MTPEQTTGPMPGAPRISIVLPAYNEAATIVHTLEVVHAYLTSLGHSFELLLGDDGSTDGTAAAAAGSGLSGVRVIQRPHQGKGGVLSDCIAEARGTYVGFLDADLEIDCRYLAPMITALDEGYDAAIASKTLQPEHHTNRPLQRRMLTRGYNAAVRWLFGTSYSDHQAGMKMFRRDAILETLPRVRSTRWIWDTEVLVGLRRHGRRVREIPIQVRTVEGRASRVDAFRTSVDMGIGILSLYASTLVDTLLGSPDGERHRSRPRAHRLSVACAGSLAVFGMAFALIPLARGRFFYYLDNAQLAFPQMDFLHRALRAGELPQWWHEVGAGFPAVAEGQAAYFFPPSLLFTWLLSPQAAMMVEVGLYLAVAGVATFAFMRLFGVGRAGAMLAGVTQMLSSLSVKFVSTMVLHRSLCLMPVVFLCAELWVVRRRPRYGLAAGATLGLQLLSGNPVVFIVTVVGTLVYLPARLLQRSWARGESIRQTAASLWLGTVRWAVVGILAIGVGAVQVMPTLRHADLSIRRGGFSFEHAAASFTARLQHLPQLFFPYAYEQGHWAQGLARFEASYSGLHVGAIPVVLAFFALWWRRRWPDPTAALASCVVIGWLIAMGNVTPLFPGLLSLPGMAGIRFPFRFLILVAFALACLGGIGLDRLVAASRLRTKVVRVWAPHLLLALGITVGGAALWLRMPGAAPGIMQSLIMIAGALALTTGILHSRSRLQRALVGVAVLGTGAELLAFRTLSGYAPSVPIAETLSPPPTVAALAHDPTPYRLLSLTRMVGGNRNGEIRGELQANTAAVWGVHSTNVYASLPLARYYALHESVITELQESPASARRLASLLGALNVKYVLAPADHALDGWDPVSLDPDRRFSLWENPALLPRAFLVGSTVPERITVRPELAPVVTRRFRGYQSILSYQNWLTRLEDLHIVFNVLADSIDYRTTAVVAGDAPTLDGADSASTVEGASTWGDRMEFTVRTDSAALLVVSSNFYPGWTATVNDQPVEIHRADWVLMGVRVPRGTSRVVFRFRTPGFRAGALVTLSTVVLLLGALAGLGARASRRSA